MLHTLRCIVILASTSYNSVGNAALNLKLTVSDFGFVCISDHGWWCSLVVPALQSSLPAREQLSPCPHTPGPSSREMGAGSFRSGQWFLWREGQIFKYFK